MADFQCGREHNGHHCGRERGHRGSHQCRCGQTYVYFQTTPVIHHDLMTMTFPESEAA